MPPHPSQIQPVPERFSMQLVIPSQVTVPREYLDARAGPGFLERGFIYQGSHKLWKSWKTWKITKKRSMHGKIMEFDKN